MSYILYILYSLKTPRTYVGYTADLKGRLRYHNGGRVVATKPYLPWKVIYAEENLSKEEAKNRETYWKSGGGRRKLKDYFKSGFPPNQKLGEARSNKI